MNHPFIQNGQYNTKPELLIGVMLLDNLGSVSLTPMNYLCLRNDLAPLIAPDKADTWLVPYKKQDFTTAWNHIAERLSPETCDGVYALNLGLNKANNALFPNVISPMPVLSAQNETRIGEEIRQIANISHTGNKFFNWATPMIGAAALACHVVGIPAPDPAASFSLAATLVTNAPQIFGITFAAHGAFLGYDFAMRRRTTRLTTQLAASATKRIQCAAALCKILTSGTTIAQHVTSQNRWRQSRQAQPRSTP